jgi:putative ABC transport system permease protein
MLTAMLRDLRAHRGRVAMTLAAIALGVCAVVASWVVSDSSVATLTADAGGRDGVDVSVSTGEGGALSRGDLDRLAEIDGVDHVTGVAVLRAGLVGRDGELVDFATPLGSAGTGWDASGRFALAEGRAPERDGEIAVDAGAAERTGTGPGDEVRVLLPEGRVDQAVVVGAFDYRSLGEHDADGTRLDPRPLVAFDPATAAGLAGGFARAELAVEPGTGVEGVSREAGEVAGADAWAATGAELAAEADRAAAEAVWDLRWTLLPFAAVALLVGVFIIANTFSLLVAQRIRYFALLRAVGARRRQVRRTVLAEAVVLALLGATAGGVSGAVLGAVAMRVLHPVDELVIAGVVLGILAGYAAAVPVTVVAALGAVRRAGAVSPMEALRAAAVEPRRVRARQSALGTVLLVAGAAAVLATASPSEATVPRLVALSGAAVGAIGVLLLTPAMAARTLGPVSALLRRWSGPAGRLGLRGATRDPGRTAGTASAVTVGLGLVCAIATLSASFASLIASTTEANLPASTTVLRPTTGATSVLSPGGEESVLGRAEVAEVAALPEVDTVMAGSDVLADIDLGDGRTQRVVSVVDPEGMGEVLTPRMVEGTSDLAEGVVMAKNQADMLGLEVGDPLTLGLEDTDVATTVVGLYEASEMSASVFVDSADAPESLRERVSSVYASGPDPVAARQAIERAMADRPDVEVTGRDAIIAEDVDRQRVGFAVMYAMFGVAVLVAVFGVVNTLVLSVRERAREIGVLRAVGARRALVRRAIRVESLVVCMFGGVLGVVLGVGVGSVMQHAMLGQPLWSPTVPFGVVAAALTGMVVLALLAAVWPAGIAARTDPLRAVSGE